MRMSTDGRWAFVRFDTGKPIVRELANGKSRSFDLEAPLQWLPGGSIVGEDHHRVVIVNPSTSRQIWSSPISGHLIAVSPDLHSVAQIENKKTIQAAH